MLNHIYASLISFDNIVLYMCPSAFSPFFIHILHSHKIFNVYHPVVYHRKQDSYGTLKSKYVRDFLFLSTYMHT